MHRRHYAAPTPILCVPGLLLVDPCSTSLLWHPLPRAQSCLTAASLPPSHLCVSLPPRAARAIVRALAVRPFYFPLRRPDVAHRRTPTTSTRLSLHAHPAPPRPPPPRRLL